jgi:Xaa-Pro aminopeptidase
VLKVNDRVKKLRELMDEKGIVAYIVTTSDPHQSEYVADYYKDRAWITGFTGSAGTAVITQDEGILFRLRRNLQEVNISYIK